MFNFKQRWQRVQGNAEWDLYKKVLYVLLTAVSLLCYWLSSWFQALPRIEKIVLVVSGIGMVEATVILLVLRSTVSKLSQAIHARPPDAPITRPLVQPVIESQPPKPIILAPPYGEPVLPTTMIVSEPQDEITPLPTTSSSFCKFTSRVGSVKDVPIVGPFKLKLELRDIRKVISHAWGQGEYGATIFLDLGGGVAVAGERVTARETNCFFVPVCTSWPKKEDYLVYRMIMSPPDFVSGIFISVEQINQYTGTVTIRVLSTFGSFPVRGHN